MITLTTPTGNIGSKVLRYLIEHAPDTTKVRVIVRDPGKLPEDVRDKLQVVQGDSRDESLLRTALEDTSALFWCQPDTPDAPDYVRAYETWSEVARAAIDTAQVPRVVAISAVGHKPGRPAGPITALARLEEIVGQSDASCRFLCCGSFYSNVLWQWESITRDGVFYYGAPGDRPGPQVATEDIAQVASRWLLDENWTGKEAIALPGPADLTYDQMAEKLSHQLGKPIRYEAVPAQAYAESMVAMGLTASAAQGMADMFTFLANEYEADGGADRSLTPTTFEQWLRENAPV